MASNNTMNNFTNGTNFLCWKYLAVVGKNGEKRLTKVPYHPNGYKIDITRPENLVTYNDAKQATGFDGIGFVIKGGLIGIDLDKVVLDGKIIDENAWQIVNSWKGYMEYSPSGTGIHLLGFLQDEFIPKRKSYSTGKDYGSGEVKYEVYTENRFFTFTEDTLQSSMKIRSYGNDELERLLRALGYPWETKREVQNVQPLESTDLIRNEIVLDKLLEKIKYRKLFNLDDGDYENDTSAADMAFMCQLQYLTGANRTQMKEVFLMTPRAKRDKVAIRKDYLDRLVDDSINKYPCSQYYSWNKKQESINAEKYAFTSVEKLLNEPDEEYSWILDGVLPSSGFSLLVAKPKVGKSTFARELCVAVAKGEEFLGKATQQGSVVYLAIEEKRQEVKEHFKTLNAQGLTNISIYVGRTPEKALEWLKLEVDKVKPVLIVIDTLFRFVRVKDLNAYTDVTKALDDLLELVRTRNSHLMVLHHANKHGRDSGDATLGSTAIFGSVDTLIQLTKSDGQRYIHSEQRYGIDIQKSALTLDVNTGRIILGESKEAGNVEAIIKRIVDYLDTKDTPVFEQDITTNITGKTAVIRDAVRLAYYKGLILRTGSGVKGNPYMYSRIMSSHTDLENYEDLDTYLTI